MPCRRSSLFRLLLAAPAAAQAQAWLASPEFQQRLRALGYEAAGGTPAEFARAVQRDRDKWTRLIRERGISIE